MRYFLLTILIVFAFDTFSQRNVSGVVFNEIGEPLATEEHLLITCIYPSRLSIGANYDFINSMFGLSFSNGYDIRPSPNQDCFLEDIFFFKIDAQTNFDQDYFFGTNLMWSRGYLRFFNQSVFILPSIGFKQYDLSSQGFFHRDIYVSATIPIQRWKTELTLKAGYQTLNDFNNLGATVGFRKQFWYPLRSGGFFGHYGASVGYYFDYFIYSAYIQGRISRNIHYRLTYDRIDNHDFLNVGLSYLFNRRRR